MLTSVLGTIKITQKHTLSIKYSYIKPHVMTMLSIPTTKRRNAMTIQGGPAKVRPTYIFDGNICMHS